MPRREGKLLFKEFFDLFLNDLLVEKLAAGDAVDLGAKSRNPVLVVVLHACLPCHGGADEIVAQNQIGGGEKVTDREDAEERQCQRRHPRADRHMPDPVATGEDQNVFWGTFPEDAVLRKNSHQMPPIGDFHFAWEITYG